MSRRPTPVMPFLLGGVLMAIYLLLRPYGDATGATTPEAAHAFASQLWIAAHVGGMLALGAYALGVHRLLSAQAGRAALVARRAAVTGAFLVQPYYGAEAFGLHVVGVRALTRPELLDLVTEIRDNGWAMALFVAGLLSLLVSGVALAIAWAQGSTRRWAVWPLAALMVLFVPQYYLPPVGRMAFGVAFLLSSLALAWALTASRTEVDGRGVVSEPSVAGAARAVSPTARA